MSILLYDLSGAEDRRFSPYCWRVRMALAHKGLDYHTQAVAFTDIPALAGGGYKTVPIIDDNGQIIVDSQAIADYLEDHYPDQPSLFGGIAGRALTDFVQHWVNRVLHPALGQLVVKDIHDRLQAQDQAYFRSSREQRFGRPLEEVQADREQRVHGFRESLQPLRVTLRQRHFLSGEQPLYADYIVFGALQWVRVISPFQVLAADDPVQDWFQRCLALYEGLGLQQAAA